MSWLYFFPLSIFAVPIIWTGELLRYLISFGNREPNFRINILEMELFFSHLFSLSFWIGVLFWGVIAFHWAKSSASKYNFSDYTKINAPSYVSEAERRQEFLNINEAVIKYELSDLPNYKNRTEAIKAAQVIFIQEAPSINPPNEFLNRFLGYKKPIKHISEAVFLKDDRGYELIKDRTTGEKGFVFAMTDSAWFEWKTKNEVRVGNMFLKKENGKWRVVHFQYVFGV